MSLASSIFSRPKKKSDKETFEEASIKAVEKQERLDMINRVPWLRDYVIGLDLQATALSNRVNALAVNESINNEDFVCLARVLATQAHTLREQHKKLIN